ncbi:MAG: hypothetical protein KDJ77_20285 [Rhodobiaceae bacterium]|nr:hypothetical protein [Rhodobiaceae bacterium]
MRVLFAAVLLLAPLPAAAQAVVYEAPIVLKSQTKAAEIDVTLSRAAESEPALFRILAADARHYMTEFQTRADADFAEYGSQDFWRAYNLSVSYDDVMITPRFLDVLSVSSEYTGGAHGNTGYEAFLFDREKRAMVTLEDLFGPLADDAPALAAMRDFVHDDLVAQKTRRFPDVFKSEEDVGLQDIRASREFLDIFTVEPSTDGEHLGGITFHFAPYIVGAYAEGPYEVTIPQAVFAQYLVPDYQGAFAGDPAVSARLPALGEPGSAVTLAGIVEGGHVPQAATLAGEAPRHWFAQGPMVVRFVDGEGKVRGEAAISAQAGPAGQTGFAMARFGGGLAIDAPAGTTGRLVFVTSDPRPLPRPYSDETGPAEAEIAVVVE